MRFSSFYILFVKDPDGRKQEDDARYNGDCQRLQSVQGFFIHDGVRHNGADIRILAEDRFQSFVDAHVNQRGQPQAEKDSQDHAQGLAAQRGNHQYKSAPSCACYARSP